jgi:hypothetical protein
LVVLGVAIGKKVVGVLEVMGGVGVFVFGFGDLAVGGGDDFAAGQL